MRSLTSVLAFLLTASLLAPAPVPFASRQLADDLAGGYQVAACDVNGDGQSDLLVVASGMPDLLWFEAPDWKRHVLAAHLPRMINAACWNRAPKSLPQIAVAYEFSMDPAKSAGVVAILTPGPDPREPWKVGEIDRLPTSHRLRWADIDGSGNKVLLNAPLANAQARAPDFRGSVPLVYYRPGDWKRQLISEAEQGIVHGILVMDWDGDGRDEILIGSFTGIHLYKLLARGAWQRSEITRGSPAPWPKSGTSDIAAGTLQGERFLAAIEPWHGNELAVYRKQGGAWQRQVIDDGLLDAHTLHTSDFDGDGNDEIVAGFRGKPYGVYLYRNSGRAWTREIVDEGGMSAAGCAVGLFGGERPGIVCTGSATHNLKMYRQTPAKP